MAQRVRAGKHHLCCYIHVVWLVIPETVALAIPCRHLPFLQEKKILAQSGSRQTAECDLWPIILSVRTGGRPSRWWWLHCLRKPTVPPRSCSPTPGRSSGRACPTTPHEVSTFHRSETKPLVSSNTWIFISVQYFSIIMTTDTHRAVAVHDQGLNQLFAVQWRRSAQGGESQQSHNQLCSHGWRQRAAREQH